ncbi:hypothetical protein GCM10017044_19860 [Kordiimonas sediminis]|uniref:Uncharacterized protein n=1 Tax=Kordiimonas sediminis TaxID=1735581 RepID=A0A919ASQ7_9PROT|nr:hypothetical protein GCM10017044_19860 [Kordiimonas sediminis]
MARQTLQTLIKLYISIKMFFSESMLKGDMNDTTAMQMQVDRRQHYDQCTEYVGTGNAAG